MFEISITPYFRPRRPGSFWSRHFETVPSIQVLRRTIEKDRDNFIKAIVTGDLEASEDNCFMRDAVFPKCLLTLDAAGELPSCLPSGKMKIHTVFRGSKVFGSIAIKQMGDA